MATETVTSPVLAWYFLPSDRRLPYPPHTEVKPGLKLVHEGTLALSGPGLHASIRALDALYDALGPVVCRVEMAGAMLHDANQRGANKLVARECTCLWLADASNVLHEFVCQWAEQALLKEREAGREPDARSWKAIDAKRAWLAGKMDDQELAAAADAGAAAARDATAARDAAWATIWAARAARNAWAARDAAWPAWAAAAWAAAAGATWATAWATAAWGTAWAAARDFTRDVTGDVTSAVWAAARDTAATAARNAWPARAAARNADACDTAAWGAAWDATWAAQNSQLEVVLNGLHSLD